MAQIYNAQQNTGFFLPSTYIFDVAELNQVDVNSPQFKELLVRLYMFISNMNTMLNLKETGQYQLQELLNSQQWFIDPQTNSPSNPQSRFDFRTTVLCGALPNTGTSVTPHNIGFTDQFTITRLYGAATDHTGLNYINLSYASPVPANNIELRADGTNVYITTGSNRTNFDYSLVVLEYLKNL
jgi:hypothetical protein